MVVTCAKCGTVYYIDDCDPDVCLFPYPHIQCYNCHELIPLF